MGDGELYMFELARKCARYVHVLFSMDNPAFFDDTPNDLILASQLVDKMLPTAGIYIV